MINLRRWDSGRAAASRRILLSGRMIQGTTINSAFDKPCIYQFPPVTLQDVLEIAAKKIGLADVALVCHGRKPARCNIYNAPAEPCWWIVGPWDDGHSRYAMRSSRLILVGRRTGVVHYDGLADDEG